MVFNFLAGNWNSKILPQQHDPPLNAVSCGQNVLSNGQKLAEKLNDNGLNRMRPILVRDHTNINTVL